MQVLPSFDPSVGTSGNINVSAADSGCKLLLYNLSIYAIQLNFEDGSTDLLHAGEAKYWTLDGATPTILWTFYSKLNIATVALSLVTATLYRQDEEIEGTYPIFLPYQLFIGNTVTTAMGGSTTWQNDNNVSGTQVGETTVAGSPGSNIIIQNQGVIEVLQWVGGVLTQIFKTDPGAASVVKLGNTSLLTEVLGNLTVDQVLTAIGNTSLATLITSGLATLNSLSVTNGATVGGTLGVTGNTSMSTASTSGKATLNSAEISTTLKVDTTSEFVGNATFDASPVLSNAAAMLAKDSGGTARTILQVDGGNNLQFFGITGTDLAQFLDHSGSLGIVADLVHKSFDVKTTAVNVVGTTNGNATCYQFFTGTNVKALIILFSAYRNASGASQIMTLPVAFSSWATWVSGNGPFITPRLSGSNLVSKVRVATTLSGAGGTNTAESLLPPVGFGEIIQGFDSFDLGNTQGTNNSSVYFFIGQ